MTRNDEKQLCMDDLRRVEQDLGDMHITEIRTTMNLVTGSICIDTIELRDNDNRNSVRLSVDEDGNLRVYPTMDLNYEKPMTVRTWGIHETMEKFEK